MITINKVKYNLSLIDTCILSDLFENEYVFNNFIKFLTLNNCLIGISTFTINELMKSKTNFEKFKEYFKILPTFLVKPPELILESEISNYPYEIKPESISFIKIDFKDKFLDYLLVSEKYKKVSLFIENAKPFILNRVVDLKQNFPPTKSGKYTICQIQNFTSKVILQQLKSTHASWVRKVTVKQELKTDVFKSLKSQLLITFWKFYLMKDRKPRLSDVFDIIISSAFPYIDYVFTENNMVNDIIQIKRKGLLYNDLKALNFNDLKNANP